MLKREAKILTVKVGLEVSPTDDFSAFVIEEFPVFSKIFALEGI